MLRAIETCVVVFSVAIWSLSVLEAFQLMRDVIAQQNREIDAMHERIAQLEAVIFIGDRNERDEHNTDV